MMILILENLVDIRDTGKEIILVNTLQEHHFNQNLP